MLGVLLFGSVQVPQSGPTVPQFIYHHRPPPPGGGPTRAKCSASLTFLPPGSFRGHVGGTLIVSCMKQGISTDFHSDTSTGVGDWCWPLAASSTVRPFNVQGHWRSSVRPWCMTVSQGRGGYSQSIVLAWSPDSLLLSVCLRCAGKRDKGWTQPPRHKQTSSMCRWWTDCTTPNMLHSKGCMQVILIVFLFLYITQTQRFVFKQIISHAHNMPLCMFTHKKKEINISIFMVARQKKHSCAQLPFNSSQMSLPSVLISSVNSNQCVVWCLWSTFFSGDNSDPKFFLVFSLQKPKHREILQISAIFPQIFHFPNFSWWTWDIRRDEFRPLLEPFARKPRCFLCYFANLPKRVKFTKFGKFGDFWPFFGFPP